jgi:transposase
MAPACDLVDGVAAQNVIADKAYDAARLFEKVIDQGGDPVASSLAQLIPAEPIML